MTSVQAGRRPWLQLRVEKPEVRPGEWVADLDGRRCRTAVAFFDAIGEALDFPPYYGHNWGALHECFRDLFDLDDGGMGTAWGGPEVSPERALHLVVHHADALLADDDPRYLGIVVDYFRQPQHVYDPPEPWHELAAFRATFLCTPDAWEAFADRLHVAGLQLRDLMP